MNIKMLPNWYKKLGFMFFLIGYIVASTAISSRKSFYEGANSASINPINIPMLEPIFIEKWFGEIGLHFFDVLIVLGLLIYMLSKEKIEDDYINKLRLESYQLTSVFALFLTVILYIIFGNLEMSLDYFINLFLLVYLIIFAFKKRLY